MILVENYGKMQRAFRQMRIKHPLLADAHQVADDLRGAKRDCSPRDEQSAATLLAESASGKSTAIKMYIETRVVDDCLERGLFRKGQHTRSEIAGLQNIVLHVTLTPRATIGSLMSDILTALGDPRPVSGDIKERRYRVYQQLDRCKTELMFIDEIQHLGAAMNAAPARKRDEANDVQNSLKKFLIDGYPIFFVGRPEARKKIFNDEQVDLRVEDELEFGPLDYDQEEHRKIFFDFCGRLSLKLNGSVFDHVPDLLSGDLPTCLFQVCNGRLGLVAVFVKWASRLALRAGDQTLERKHFEQATDLHMRRKFANLAYNPFREGLNRAGFAGDPNS